MNTEEKKDEKMKHEPLVIAKTKKVISDIFNEDIDIEWHEDELGKKYLYMIASNGHSWQYRFDDDLDMTVTLGFMCTFMNEMGKIHGKDAIKDFFEQRLQCI